MGSPGEEVVRIKDQVVRNVHEHEVFLEFTDDDDAAGFLVWWGLDGKDLFLEWLAENSDEDEF